MAEFNEGGPRQRRRFPRVVSQKVLLVRKVTGDSSSLEEFARSNSLGLNGCGFVSSEPLGEGSVLEILISLGTEVVRTHARVVYEKPLDEGYDTGVEFLDLSPEDLVRISHLFEPSATPRSE